MNPIHIHLMVVHIPLLASFFGAFVLAFGLFYNSPLTRRAGIMVLIIAALGGVAAYQSGDEAEHKVEHISGISEERIESHEEAAEKVIYLVYLTGIAALLALFLNLRNHAKERMASFVVLTLSLLLFIASARLSYLGGQIRHTEIADPPSLSSSEIEAEE
jgi:cell division protein FtsW (lipid II flippase)